MTHPDYTPTALTAAIRARAQARAALTAGLARGAGADEVARLTVAFDLADEEWMRVVSANITASVAAMLSGPYATIEAKLDELLRRMTVLERERGG